MEIGVSVGIGYSHTFHGVIFDEGADFCIQHMGLGTGSSVRYRPDGIVDI